MYILKRKMNILRIIKEIPVKKTISFVYFLKLQYDIFWWRLSIFFLDFCEQINFFLQSGRDRIENLSNWNTILLKFTVAKFAHEKPLDLTIKIIRVHCKDVQAKALVVGDRLLVTCWISSWLYERYTSMYGILLMNITKLYSHV